MTVTYIGETEGAIPPVPIDSDGDRYEIDWPVGAAVGDVVILHAGTTKSILDAYPSRFEFGPSDNLTALPYTLESLSSLTLTVTSGPSDRNPRILSLRFGIITAQTPDPIPIQVSGPIGNPLHGTDRFGITVWRGVTQAFVRSNIGDGNEAGTISHHTAPHSVTWFGQAGFEALVANDNGDGWAWTLPNPFVLGFRLFDAIVNQDRGVGVSEDFWVGDDTSDRGFPLAFAVDDPNADAPEVSYGAFMIGLSDQTYTPPTAVDPTPETSTEGVSGGLRLTSEFGFGATIPTASEAPPPAGGIDVPAFPYRHTKDPR